MLTLLMMSLAHAADPTVAVTSFYYTNQYPDRTAEICGTISGERAGNLRVVLTIDPGNKAGTYVAWPGPDGHWCALVNSLSGHAAAGLWNGGSRSGAPVEALVR